MKIIVIDYAHNPPDVTRLQGYACMKCRKRGIKLWRLSNMHAPLLCFRHACDRANDHPRRPGRGQSAPRMLGSSMMAAAIPMELKDGQIHDYWAILSVPSVAWHWWDQLPM